MKKSKKIYYICFVLLFMVMLGACDEEHIHNWIEVSRSECSCTEDGKIMYLCENCDVEKQVTVQKATGHSYTSVVTAPTCTEDGYTTYTCTNDITHTYIADGVEAIGHSYTTVVKVPTCTEEGYTTYICTNDATHTYVADYVEATGHTYESVIIDPTFEDYGYTKYTCIDCDNFYYDSYVSKLEHNFSSDASYNEYYHWYACVDLGYEDLFVNKSEHVFQRVTIKPTGVAEGYEMHTCTECNYVYKDNFEPALTYTITWKNWDGTVLETDNNVKYGVVPTYDGETPEKVGNVQYSYIFDGWNKNINIVTGDATYIAKFRSELNVYRVTWKHWDGTVLEVDENLHYGEIPTYNGEIPTRESNAQYSYIFDGWDRSVGMVMGDATYIAKFRSMTNFYRVTWKNWDGTVLEVDEYVNYGDIPTYNGEIPTKEKNDTHRFEYIGWTPKMQLVEADVIYTACFKEISRTEFYVTFNLNGGIGTFNMQRKNVGENLTLSLSVPILNNHKFVGWNNIYEERIYQAGDSFSLDKDVELWAMWEKLCTCCDGDGIIENFEDCSKCTNGYIGTSYYYCRNHGTLYYDEAVRYCTKCENLVNSYFMGKLFCDYCRDNTSTKAVCGYCWETVYLRTSASECSSCSGTGGTTTLSNCTNCTEGVIPKPSPILVDVEYNYVELEKLDGYEYSMDGINWQNSNVFADLLPATNYTFYQRVAACENIPFGTTSNPLIVTTPTL